MSTTIGTLNGIGASTSGSPYYGNSSSIAQPVAAGGAAILTQHEYEFYLEAKNLLSDMANDEELPESYRGQAKRLIARAVLSKL